MPPPSRVFRLAAIVLALMVFAGNVYRAATLPVAQDEALTYLWFLSGPVSAMFRSYDPNHHFLHTYFCKAAVSLFGVSEFSLRMPSLAGGALYLWMVLLICRRSLGEGWIFLLTAAFLSLHPLVVDFLSAARGYGMALAFFLCGLYQLLQVLGGDLRRRRLWAASAAMGLALAANFSVAYAVGGVAAAFLVALARAEAAWGLPRPGRALADLALPAAAIGSLLMLPPLLLARRDQFGTDAKSLLEMLRSLAEISYAKTPQRPAVWLAAESLRDGVWVGLVAAPMAAAAWHGLRRIGKGNSGEIPGLEQALLGLTGAAIPAAFAGVAVVHGWSGFDYPEGRTALFWIPLWGLSLGALARTLRGAGQAAAAGVVAFSAAQFALQFDLGPYFLWRQDASTRRFVSRIAAERGGRAKVRVYAARRLQPALRFYRAALGYQWLEVDDRGPQEGCDYYLILPDQREAIGRLRLAARETGQASGVTLAARGP